MKNDHFRSMLKDAPYAYALHEIMLDDQGKPYDYRYIEVNDAFRKLTGIETTEIFGKTVTELLPGIRSGSFDWVEYYGKIALEGGHETFEQYSEPLGKWYRVLVHSPKKHFFSTIFADITLEKEFETYKKRLQLAQSFTGTGAWEYDIKTQSLYWSTECEKLFGLEEGAFEGTFDDFLKRVHPNDRQYVLEVNKPVTELKEGIPLHYEHRIIRDDGEVLWVRESAGVVHNDAGKPAKIIGFVTDITAQKKNEEKLENEEKLREIINNIDGAFWLMSADKEEVHYLSPSFECIFGRPLISIKGKLEAYFETIHDEDKDSAAKAYSEFIKTGQYNQTYRIIRPDGSIRWVNSKAFPVKNEQGAVIRYAGIITDITDQKKAEAEAQKLQATYKEELDFRQFLFNKNKDGLVIVNNDHKVVDANTEFLRMLGYSMDEIKHLHTWDYDAIATEEDIRTGIDTSKDVDSTFESKHKRKDGSVYDVEISARSFHWKGERLVVCTCRDITERKRMQRETLEAKRLAEANQHRFEQIAEHTSEFIWEVDKDGIYTYANSAVEKILGYKPEELVGKINCYDFLSEGHKTKTIEEVSKTIDHKEPIRNLENVMISKSGQEVHVITNGIPVFDADGELIGYRGSDRDITDRIKAEKALKESEEKFRRLAYNLHAGIVVHDAYTKITFCNKEASNLLGLAADQLSGRDAEHPDWYFLNEQGDKIEMDEYPVNVVFSSKKSLLNKTYGIVDPGKNDVKWVLVNAYPEHDQDGQIFQVVVTFINITQIKQAEEEMLIAKEKAESASRLKTAFIDNISHEIRTPLNGIVGFGQLIAQENLTLEDRTAYFGVLERSTDRLIQTVTDFMDISRIASDNLKVNTREFLLREVLEEQLQRFNKVCQTNNVSLKLEMPGHHQNMLLNSDDELLKKVLGHLLANAAKFTEKGSITFGYTMKKQHLEFFVKDQGKGIAADRLETIFDAFVQENPEMTRGHEGSGLGLAITKGIVQLLGGSVWLKSEKGKGSEFYFTIPYHEEKFIEKPLIPNMPLKAEMGSLLILVAEDDDSNFVFMDIVLKKAGYKVLRAKNGRQAVDMCESNPGISLVLMDIKMPIMSGLEATRHIKKFRSDLPVVAVTAYLKSGDEHLLKDSGCEDFCFKPFGKDDLLAMVGKYVRKTV